MELTPGTELNTPARGRAGEVRRLAVQKRKNLARCTTSDVGGGTTRDAGAQCGEDAYLALLFSLALGRLSADLLVVLLEGGQVLTGLGEFALLHALAHIPVHEGALGVHQVELVVDARVELGDRGGIGHHRDGAHDLGEVATGNDRRRLVVNCQEGREPA